MYHKINNRESSALTKLDEFGNVLAIFEEEKFMELNWVLSFARVSVRFPLQMSKPPQHLFI